MNLAFRMQSRRVSSYFYSLKKISFPSLNLHNDRVSNCGVIIINSSVRSFRSIVRNFIPSLSHLREEDEDDLTTGCSIAEIETACKFKLAHTINEVPSSLRFILSLTFPLLERPVHHRVVLELSVHVPHRRRRPHYEETRGRQGGALDVAGRRARHCGIEANNSLTGWVKLVSQTQDSCNLLRDKFALQSTWLHTVLSSHDVDFLAPRSRAQPVVGLHHHGVLGVLFQIGEGEGEAVLRGRAERGRVEAMPLLLEGQI